MAVKTNLRLAGLTGTSVLALSIIAPMMTPGVALAEGARDDVVVTARRVEERLQDTPLSITVANEQTLVNAQVGGTDELEQITPSLQIAPVAPLSGNNSAAQMFIRGIGQTDPTAGVDPGVGLYIDGVYMGSSVGGILDFHDIGNVQVLRGPQGTLFGRNTVGGAILITTKDPGAAFGGQARVVWGSDNLVEGFLAMDLPVSEQLRTRWTFGRRVRDGYVIRSVDGKDLGDENKLTFTGKAILDVSDKVRLALRGDYTKEDENGAPLVFAAINNGPPLFATPANGQAFPRVASFNAGCPGMTSPASPVPQGPNHDPRCANNSWNDGPFVANGTFPVTSQLESWGLAFTGDVRLSEAISLKSITGYRQLKWSGSRDADNTPLKVLHTEYHSDGDQLSEELQLTYRRDPLTLVGGFYYYKAETTDLLKAHLGVAAQPDHNDNIISTESWALFSQGTFKVTEALSISGGIRHTRETKGSLPSQFNEANPSNVYVLHQLFEQKFSSTIGSASIQYRWNEAVMTYGSWAQGFKSGGFNSRFNAPVPADPASGNPALSPPPFGPENAESFEVGVKLDPLSTVRVNLAAFHTRYDDIQLTYRFGVAPYIFNAGQATIRGLEGELHYKPTSAWSFDGNFSYLDDKFNRVANVTYAGQQPSTAPVTLASRLPYVPHWQGSLAVEYATMAGSLTAALRAEVVYVSSQFFDTGNTPEISQIHDVTTINLGLRVEPEGGRWQLRIMGKNITNNVYPVAGNSSLSSGAGYAEIAYNRGAEAAVSLTARF
jgi:iron complex outermembrane receptor protein